MIKLRISESKQKTIFRCFDIPPSMRLDVMELMVDKGYRIKEDNPLELVLTKVINGVEWIISVETNKHINNRYTEKRFNELMNLPE